MSQVSKPVLAVDFDDTLVSHAANIVAAYNETHEDRIELAETYFAWKLGDPKQGWGSSREAAMDWIGEYLHSEKAMNTPPVEGAKEVLERLKEHYDLQVVTGRKSDWREATQPWIERFLPGLFSDIHYVGDGRKSMTCKKINAHTIVDDSPIYIADCVAAGIRAIAFGDYPWNPDERLPRGVERAVNWIEAEKLL